MKKQILDFLSKISFINNHFSGIATIFMLHRVAPFEQNRLFPNENMKVSSEFLEKFILELKDKGYEFISLDELCSILQAQINVKKKIVFTLDDGYKDNYEIAYSVFKKHNVPFTVYVTTSFPNKKALLWWYAIEDLIIENDELIVGEEIFYCGTYEEKNRVFLQIREKILKLEQQNLLDGLQELFENYTIDWFRNNETVCMSWENIIELSQDHLCTIGGHTKNHYAFNKLDKDEIYKEIIDANNEIEDKINKKIEHFAYPFGGRSEVGKIEFDIIKSLNFKTVTTTRNGTVYFDHIKYLNCCIPRVMLTENFHISNIGKIRKQRVVTL